MFNLNMLVMKKSTLVLMSLLALSFAVKAQQYVSTEPANRNAIIEVFSGRGCGFCPAGHLITSNLMAANPGRVWTVNIHAGSYSVTSYPNFNTDDGTVIHDGFSHGGYPEAVVNRSTAEGQGRGEWNNLVNQQLSQAAECNIAGIVSINEETRKTSITVEVYYTGSSTVDENYLTVAMLQDSILGSQTNYGSSDPSQWIGDQFIHMHVLRDIIQPNAWGDVISPTTQGTLVTKTYEYQIPASIGDPNGVAVDLNHVSFLAWVSERYQNTPTRPILNVCMLEKTYTPHAVKSELANSLRLYPNPASQFLNVEGEMTFVEVYNTVGQCLLSKEVNGNAHIDLSGYSNGIYFLRVNNNGETEVLKFSVNR